MVQVDHLSTVWHVLVFCYSLLCHSMEEHSHTQKVPSCHRQRIAPKRMHKQVQRNIIISNLETNFTRK